MHPLGRFLFIANLPITLALLLWVWAGRLLFGVGGWMLLVLPLMVFPIVLVGLLVSNIVVFTTASRPRRFDTAQSLAHGTMWLGLLGTGLFLPDFGDTEDSERAFLTQLLGHSDQLMTVSWYVTFAFAALALLAWVATLVTAITARRISRQQAASGQVRGVRRS